MSKTHHSSKIVGVVCLWVFLIVSCGGGEETPVIEPATQGGAELDSIKLRVAPGVWAQFQVQPWFNEGNPSEDGMRLMKLISSYNLGGREFDVLPVLKAYPEGLSPISFEILDQLKNGQSVRQFLTASWFVDGVSDYERAFLDYYAGALVRRQQVRGWTFDTALLDAVKMPWFTDGINEREIAVVGAASALSHRDGATAVRLLQGINGDAFPQENVLLPLSGEKLLIVTTSLPGTEVDQARALSLVKQWMVSVEELFALVYEPRYVVIVIEQLGGNLCGTGSGQDSDTPGLITLNIDCVQDRTVVHELAHIFAGVGPTWFIEGIADFAVLHVTGEIGGYARRQSSGRIEIDAGYRLSDPDQNSRLNQSALGSKLFVDLYQMIGPQASATVVRKMVQVEWPRKGSLLRDVLLNAVPENQKQRVATLVAERF